MSLADLDLPIYDLHVYPTYAVCLRQKQQRTYLDREGNPIVFPRKTARQIANEENLRKRERQGGLSPKAARRLINSVNWLVASAKNKEVYEKSSKKRFSFKVNFVTLTLPTLDHGISDHKFKSVLLHNFINTCRAKHGLKNFVWKVEAQENGNIHAHFTTDTFIHWRSLRSIWNTILLKNGILDQYTKKHQDLSFEKYAALYCRGGKVTEERLRKAFAHGVSSGWSDPNTTDVHAVHKIDDVAAYLAKYMGKNEADRRQIKGRLWSCSYSLSSKNKLVIELAGQEGAEYLKPLHHGSIKWKPIQVANKIGTSFTTIGDIFFFSVKAWGKELAGPLLSEFNKFRYAIRHDIPGNPGGIFAVDRLSPPMVKTAAHFVVPFPEKRKKALDLQQIIFN